MQQNMISADYFCLEQEGQVQINKSLAVTITAFTEAISKSDISC